MFGLNKVILDSESMIFLALLDYVSVYSLCLLCRVSVR